MLSMIKSIWHDVQQGENIDTYLIIFSALVLGGLNLFGGVGQSFIAPITLTTLGVLAISVLVNRRRLDSVIAKLSQSVSGEIEGIAAFKTTRDKLLPLSLYSTP